MPLPYVPVGQTQIPGGSQANNPAIMMMLQYLMQHQQQQQGPQQAQQANPAQQLAQLYAMKKGIQGIGSLFSGGAGAAGANAAAAQAGSAAAAAEGVGSGAAMGAGNTLGSATAGAAAPGAASMGGMFAGQGIGGMTAGGVAGTAALIAAPLILGPMIQKTFYKQNPGRQFKLDEAYQKNNFGTQFDGYSGLKDDQKKKWIQAMHDKGNNTLLLGDADMQGNTKDFGQALFRAPAEVLNGLHRNDQSLALKGAIGNGSAQKAYDELLAYKQTHGGNHGMTTTWGEDSNRTRSAFRGTIDNKLTEIRKLLDDSNAVTSSFSAPQAAKPQTAQPARPSWYKPPTGRR